MKRRTFLGSLAALLGITTLGHQTHSPTMSTGRTYYLAPWGNDANDGSKNHPWRTFRHDVNAGDTLWYRSGTYTQNGFISGSGTEIPR